jgi:TRAP-type C4-dicarboxylate transport system permease small subunit
VKRAYHALMQGCGAAAALALGAVALLVTLDVLVRNTGAGTLPWVVEVSEYSLPFATFLAAPWLLYRNEHVRLDMLLTAVPTSVARGIDRAADVIGLLICLVFLRYGVYVIADSARQGSMVDKTLAFPEWWLYVPVPFCFGLLAVEFVRRMFVANFLAASGPRA